MLTQEIIRVLLTASAFGCIIFFATVLSPTVFKVLDGDDAADFFRGVIPRYFFFLIVVTGFGAFSSWESPGQAAALGFISVTSLYVRQVALPQILEWRDLQMDGDQSASQKFIRGRRYVLILTAVHLLLAGAVLARAVA